MQNCDQVTEWFTIGLHGNPVHPGFYEVVYEFDQSNRTEFPLRYWNGDWYLDELDFVECQGGKSKSCCFGWDGDKWRGLAQQHLCEDALACIDRVGESLEY